MTSVPHSFHPTSKMPFTKAFAHEDIVAGLVYAICMNYANRVKGNRPIGE